MPDDVSSLGWDPARIDWNLSLEDKMSTTASHGQSVHANGIDIHYLDQGDGDTLVLLHGGVVSTTPLWTGVPIAPQATGAVLASRFSTADW